VAIEQGKPIIDRRAILEKEIYSYVRRGYRVLSQTETSAQLVKPKKFSLLWCILFFGIFYIVYYMAKKDKTVWLTIDALGNIHKK
jgi:hypothetical protein